MLVIYIGYVFFILIGHVFCLFQISHVFLMILNGHFFVILIGDVSWIIMVIFKCYFSRELKAL